MRRRIPILSLPIPWVLLLLLCPGCRGVRPEVLTLELEAPEKDVLVCSVEVRNPVPATEYLGWARRNIEGLGARPRNPFYLDTPVYELIYAFHSGGTRLATVQYRVGPDDRGTDALHYVSTQVYHEPMPGVQEP